MNYNRKLIDYLPLFLQNYREFKSIMESENEEIKKADESVDKVLDSQFIDTADETGIELYERMLDIENLISDTLNDRKARILSLWNTDTPYTFRKFIEMVRAIQGDNDVNAEIDYGESKLTMTLHLSSKGQYESLKKLIEKVMPCNIAVITNSENAIVVSNRFSSSLCVNLTEVITMR